MALRCFEVAARLENFTRAAEELHLTHGAVSRAVRTLEDDLGTALFERRQRRVLLTEAGRRLAGATSEGFGLIRSAALQLRRQADRSSRWTLSCEPTLLMRWLIPRWPAFQALHPELNVQFDAGGGPVPFDNGIDLAIRRDDFERPDGLFCEPLFSERIGPVCRADKLDLFFDAAADGTTLRAGAPCLHTRTRPHAWNDWRALVGARACRGKQHAFDHFYFSLQAAASGLGVAIGPWHLVRDEIAAGILVAPMGFVEDGSSYCLLSREPVAGDTNGAALLSWLRSQGQ
ncbi:transcriptional regulator [Herbaspirillum sp. YR522]|nr:transcriptional regulator [Herbaspirillum sp. YR522]